MSKLHAREKLQNGGFFMLVRATLAVTITSGLALAQISADSAGSLTGLSPSGQADSTAATRALRALNHSESGAAHSDAGATILGRVILTDGGDTTAGIQVQRVCGGNVVAESRTDSEGHFTLVTFGDKSVNANTSGPDGLPGLGGCELRASLNGYRAAPVPLGRSDGGEIVILLQRVSGVHDMTVSATDLLAPKNARKAYEKGLEEERHHSPDRAQQAFQNAVKIYPRYAAAWLELGKLYEQRGHGPEARDAYLKSASADDGYLFPDERLSRLDLRESRWQEAADTSTKVLRLDPYEFPQAYYVNAVANLELNHLDQAERSAREAAKLEGSHTEPLSNYVLGIVLWRKGDLNGAEEKLQAFLATSTDRSAQASAQRALHTIQQQQSLRNSWPAAVRTSKAVQ